MNIEEFIGKYDGKYVEVAGPGSLNQCVDLSNAFMREVQNMPIIEHADAKMVWDKAGPEYQRIEPNDFPKKNDIVIWSSGSYGHIAVVTGIRNGDKFQTFSQNDPLKSPAHLQDYPLSNKLKGYLRLEEEVDEREIIKPVFCHALNGYFATIYGRSYPDPVAQFSKDFEYWYGRFGKECAGQWIGQQPKEAEFQATWIKKADVAPPTDCTAYVTKLEKIKEIIGG